MRLPLLLIICILTKVSAVIVTVRGTITFFSADHAAPYRATQYHCYRLELRLQRTNAIDEDEHIARIAWEKRLCPSLLARDRVRERVRYPSAVTACVARPLAITVARRGQFARQAVPPSYHQADKADVAVLALRFGGSSTRTLSLAVHAGAAPAAAA